MEQNKTSSGKSQFIECNICCSGFLVASNDLYCGFCGNPVHSCELNLISTSEKPLYVDQTVPIKIKVCLENTGMTPFEPGKLKVHL